jgi:hypothetical protein
VVGVVGGETYGDTGNCCAHGRQEIHESDDSSIEHQAVYQHKDGGVQRILNQVLHHVNIKNGPRHYKNDNCHVK